jgi:hypothetical protein
MREEQRLAHPPHHSSVITKALAFRDFDSEQVTAGASGRGYFSRDRVVDPPFGFA